MSDPYAFWPPIHLAEATQCPEINIRKHWPIIVAALEARGIDDRPTQVAAAATIAIETASTFEPVREAFWLSEAWRQANLRYYPWYGRGHIQLTWEKNYQKAEIALGVDLTTNPDRALDPRIAADVLAWFFAEHGIPQAARRGDWTAVRRLVQGGSAGLDRLLQIVAALGGSTPVPTPLPFNPDVPVDQQPDDWSCSLQATQWLLRSIGRNPDASDPQGDPWMRSELIPNYITPAKGLLDGSGRQLAVWITEMYGKEMGFVAQASPVTFDDVWAGAGVNPMMCGGGAYYHWVGIRRRNADGTLAIANPAIGYKGVGESLSRSQWDQLGPWSAIWVDRMSTLTPAPPPVQDTRLTRARALLEQAIAVLDESP